MEQPPPLNIGDRVRITEDIDMHWPPGKCPPVPAGTEGTVRTVYPPAREGHNFGYSFVITVDDGSRMTLLERCDSFTIVSRGPAAVSAPAAGPPVIRPETLPDPIPDASSRAPVVAHNTGIDFADLLAAAAGGEDCLVLNIGEPVIRCCLPGRDRAVDLSAAQLRALGDYCLRQADRLAGR